VDSDVTEDDAVLWCELFQMIQIKVLSYFFRSKKSSLGPRKFKIFFSKRKCIFDDIEANNI